MKRRFTILTAALALLTFLAVPMGMRGQAPVGTTLWEEDFSGFGNNADPSGNYTNSHTGTTVYGGVTITYSKTNGGGTTQTYTSGGPNSNSNLLIAKGNGTFTISGISTGEATELTVSYAKSGSGTIAISSSTANVSVSGSTSESTITTNGASTISITFTNTNTNQNLRIDDIKIIVKTAGNSGNLEDSDLALTGAPVALSFDLYNNASAQTVSYTTSSTGAIIITPETSEYFTYEHNATAKTITVTPTAVTPSAQTVTISQSADDTYASGSVSFTVAISAPTIVISEEQLSLSGDANENGSFPISFTNGFVPNVAISPTFYSDAACLNQLSGDAAWIVITETDQNSINYNVTANTSTAARTAYLKVNATSNYTGNVVSISNVFTVTQAAPDYATLPFTYDGNGAGNLPIGFTVSDLGTYSSSPAMKFDDSGDYAILKINEHPGILTFDIKGNTFSGGTFKVQTSEDGVTYTDLKTYTALGNTQSEEFTNLGENVRYIKWIYTFKSSGNVALGNIALAEYVAPNPYNLTVSLNDNVNAIYVFNAADQNNPLIAGGAAGTVQVLERTSIMISPDVAEGCALTSLMVNGVNVIDQLDESGAYTFTMPSQNVAISATAMATTTYTLATTIESGKSYIIVGQDNGNYFAMGQQNTTNRAAVGISVDDNKATVTSEDVYEFVIESEGEDVYSIYDARYNDNAGGYLYAASSGSNHLKTEEELDANGKWAISIGEGGVASVVAQGTNTHKYMRFNINSSNNNPLFSCYVSTSDLPKVYLFEKTYTYTLTIEGYGESTGGYYLIASPVTVDPEDAGMITDHFTGEELTPATSTYDLYYFDQTAEKEWKNYRNSTFDLVPGTGYLYASKEGGEFTLTGDELYNGDGVIPLTQGSGNWADWNLVGNPYGVGAVIYNDYYVMNSEGSGLVPGVDHHVTAMQGVFVKYDPELLGAGFYPDSDPYGITSVQSEDRLVFNLLRNRGTLIDRAIVRFGEGRQMTKFTLFENSTKLYIPQDDEDYAIVRTEAQGELPVSFRASENGTYTLSMNVENVDMNYLHLIDNMTGMDVDLLQTPSYTFEANTNDYANRFKLVFAANGTNEADESSFAFFSNGNLIVNNEGNATLQVIDINGRILSSETISGSCSKAINATTGVYMLRLINGDNVKVQKVVVR